MDQLTKSLTINPLPHYTIQVLDETMSPCIHIPDKLNVLLIEKGHVTFTINAKKFSTMSPLIICINETETLTFSRYENIKGVLLTFHPSAINEKFNFTNARHFDHNFSTDDIEDMLHLSIFFKRYDTYMGQIRISNIALNEVKEYISQLTTHAKRMYQVNPLLKQLVIYIEDLVKTNSSLADAMITDASFEMKDVLFYLHSNYKEKITIPQLSKHFHVNRTTLSDRFYEATGETIITYLNKQRINMSAVLLRESVLPISDVSAEVGFNDTAYFAKLFKKYIHHTPTEYRLRYQSLCQMDKP